MNPERRMQFSQELEGTRENLRRELEALGVNVEEGSLSGVPMDMLSEKWNHYKSFMAVEERNKQLEEARARILEQQEADGGEA
jgi:hypothetical protein